MSTKMLSFKEFVATHNGQFAF